VPGFLKSNNYKKKEKILKKKITLFFPCSLGAGSGNRTCGNWSRELHCGHCNAYIFLH